MMERIGWFSVNLPIVLALLCGRGGTTSFLDTHIGQNFLTAYITTYDVNRINIFVPATGDNSSIPVGVLRNLTEKRVCSVAVHRIERHDQVTQVLRTEKAEVLSVALLNTEDQLHMFRKACESEMVRFHTWLVLGDISLLDQSSEKLDLPLDNLVTFASLDDPTNTTNQEHVEMWEVYSVRIGVPYVMRRLGTWHGQRRVPIPREDWSDRRTNLTGLHLKCITMAQAPFIFLSEPNSNNEVSLEGGYAKDVWDMLQEIHGFTYSCKMPEDRSFGTVNDGGWTGLVGDIVRGDADVVVTSLDHNTARATAVTFTAALRQVGYRMVSRRPGLMDQTWTSFTSELMPNAWLGTLAFVILTPPFLAMCARYSPNETQKVTLKDAYILTIGAFAIQGSWLEVRSMSTRIVFFTIFVATLVVYSHYTSALVSLLTVASTGHGFTSLQELRQDGTYKFGFQKGTYLEEGFKTARHSIFEDVWNELVLSDPSNLVDSPHTGMKKVVDEQFVFMMEENEYKSLFGQLCAVRLLKGAYFTTHTGFALTKGSPLKKIFDVQLGRMRDGGVLSRAWQKWQSPPALCTAPRVVIIAMRHLSTAFLLLLLGFSIAIFLLPCEKLHWNIIGRRKTFLEKENQLAVERLPPSFRRTREMREKTKEQKPPSYRTAQDMPLDPPQSLFTSRFTYTSLIPPT